MTEKQATRLTWAARIAALLISLPLVDWLRASEWWTGFMYGALTIASLSIIEIKPKED